MIKIYNKDIARHTNIIKINFKQALTELICSLIHLFNNEYQIIA